MPTPPYQPASLEAGGRGDGASLGLNGRGQSLKAWVCVAPPISLAPMFKPSPVVVGKTYRTSDALNTVNLLERGLDGPRGTSRAQPLATTTVAHTFVVRRFA